MKTYQNILIILYVLYFFTNALVYLPSAGFFPYEPFQTIIIFFVFTTPILLKSGKVTFILLYNPVFWWAIIYFVLSILFFVFSSASYANAFQQIKYNFLMCLTLLIGVILFEKKHIKMAQVLIIISVLLGIVLNFYELFNPLTFSKDLGRMAGMYQNSNVSALALLIGLVFCIDRIPSLWRGLFISLVGLAVFITFSRAGMLTFGLLLGLMYYFKKFNPLPLISIFVVLIFLIFFIDIFGISDVLHTNEISTMMERINFFGNDQALSDDSSYQRSRLLQMGIDKYLSSPIFGSGLGSGQEVSGFAYSGQSTHNQYVYVLIEFGLLGLFLLFGLIGIIVKSVTQVQKSFEISAFLLIYLVNCFFSHNMFDSYFLLVIISIIPVFGMGVRESSILLR